MSKTLIVKVSLTEAARCATDMNLINEHDEHECLVYPYRVTPAILAKCCLAMARHIFEIRKDVHKADTVNVNIKDPDNPTLNFYIGFYTSSEV